MVSRGGRCLCLVLILTGFLLGTTNGQTTMGPTTTLDIVDCASMPCMNGGTCTDGTNLYTCDCTGTGFEGTNCEIDIDECEPDPCMNGGTCTDDINSYTCDCTGTGYEGTDCTIDINECMPSPCMNGATCVDGIAYFTCTCVAGYTGTLCGTNIVVCPSSTCMNGGTCEDGIDRFTCSCVPGYEGDMCDTNINECMPSPCMNGATCEDGIAYFTCTCVAGYTGTTCDTNINECMSSPCMNGATCVDGINSFTCTCVAGYTGTTCDTNIDECMSKPCANGGNCTDLVNGFNCSCPKGFNGTTCEFDIDACDPNPCDNAATCTNHLMNPGDVNYTCVCMPGWTGRNCSEDIRECESTPCENGGNCSDGTDYYNCTCLPGFNGIRCENKCPEGTFGDYCSESCTCVDGANCSNVDGNCTCDPAFEGALCDRSEVKVTARRTSNDTISKDEDFTLACRVNLAGIDLDEVAWYRDSVKLPNETDADYMVYSNPGMGMYDITILRADAVDTGAYRCTAVTKENQFSATSENISVDVVVPGKIKLGLSKLEDYIQLNQTASLNCTVFSSSYASIAWERNGVRLQDNVNRTSIESSQEMGTGGTYFFSVLNISDIAREDDGIYRCLAFDEAGNMTDSADFTIFVQEVAELANPRYDNVLSMQLQLVWDFTVQGNDVYINCTAKYGIQGTNETGPDVVGSTSPIVVTGLEPYTIYEFQLICVNFAGSSEPLDFPPQRTLAGKPSQPQNVGISQIQARQVFVQWEEPDDKNGPIDQYVLTAKSDNQVNIYPLPVQETSAEFTGLTPYTNYRIYVQALNLNSEEGTQTGSESVPSEIFETLQAAPGKPAEFSVDDTSTECIISWGEPSEPNGVITQYTLYIEILKMGTDVVDETEIKEVPGSQLQITSTKAELAPFSVFRYSITASTVLGEGVIATTTDTCKTPQGDIDDCSSDPCMNGGTCMGLVNGYTCSCPTGFNGIHCETGAACSPLIFLNASFPDGREGDVVDSSETCPIYTTLGGTPIGRAECVQNTTSGELAWNITMYLNDCGPLRETNEVVDEIIEKGVTNETVIEVLEVVVVVTDMELDEGNIVNIANIISNSTALQSGDPGITTLTATIISNFAEKDQDELSAVEENTGAITQILESFEEQLNNLDISDGQSYTALEMNVAVQVTSVEPADFLSGLTISASSTSSDLRQTDITLNDGDQEEILTGTRVSIPSSVLSKLSSEDGSESGVRLALTVFSTSSLFTSQHIRGTNAGQSSFNRTVNSLVIGLTLGRQKMATLGENIVFKYTPLQSGFQDPECVFWDFEDTLDWSSRGCRKIPSSVSDQDGEITCSCDHLTNFAVLMDIYYERVEALRIISIIGCAISIVCLVIILITYLSNKNLHVHQSQKIFMCLCGTLLGLYLTFLIMSALDRHPDYPEVTPVPCGILAALVHFFTLSSMAWMGVEGINTYLIVVRVFDAYIPRFMLKASIVAWGVSGLIVLLTGLASQGNYAATDYCFLQKWPSVGGLLIPIAIILLANIVIFSLVVRRLIKSVNVASNSDAAGTNRKASIERIKNAVSVLLLLGLTWVTGYLTLIDTTSQVTQTLFIVFNSLQGFFIFILYCARNPVVRAYWAKVCGCGQDSSRTSTRANQGTSQGISLTKTKSTSENDHDYENPSFDENKEYTDLDFSQGKKGGDPTKPTSSGKEYTGLDFSKIEKGGDPTKSFDGKEDVDPAYEVCII